MKKRNGFSLIEILIALAIMGMISALTAPQFSKIYQGSKKHAIKVIMHSLQVSLESYLFLEGYYPNGTQLTLPQLLAIINHEEILYSLPKNPYTNQLYNTSDESGSILYNETENGYTLSGYGNQNQTLILSLTN